MTINSSDKEDNKEDRETETNEYKDINTIITTIKQPLNILIDGINKLHEYTNNDKINYITNELYDSTIKLSRYINNVSDYLKYIEGDIEIDNDIVYIKDIIEELINIYTLKFNLFKINFIYNLTNQITEYNYLIDRKYFKQILKTIIDIIIYEVEMENILTEHKILLNIEYNNNELVMNVYYISNKNINEEIKLELENNIFNRYNIKYNIINLLIKKFNGSIIYYNNLEDLLSYNKQINIKLKSNQVLRKRYLKRDLKENKIHINIVIMGNENLYLDIIENALSYYKELYNFNIIKRDLKSGLKYIIENNDIIDFIFIDIEFNNINNINIMNNLYKFKNLKFIITTSIEYDNMYQYVGKELDNKRIYIYNKPINEQNIHKIKDFLSISINNTTKYDTYATLL